MRPLLLVVRKDLLRWWRSPLMAIVFLIFPLLFSFIIGLAFGNNGSGQGLPAIPLALVDEDHGLAARAAAAAFTSGKGPIRFEVKTVDLPAATKMIEANKVSAVLRLPAGFTDHLMTGTCTQMSLVKNPAESINPTIVEEYVGVLALLGTSASRLLGDPMREIRESGKFEGIPSDAFISRVSVDIGHRIRGIGRFAFPPAIRLEKPAPPADAAKKPSGSSTPFAIALFVLPGMATFSLLTLAMTSMADLRREEVAGTLARQFTMPSPVWATILGKALATLILALACILVLSIVAAVMSSGATVSLPGFVALALAFAIATTGFATLLQSLFDSERTGTAVGSIILMVMSMIGGSWIPLNVLPSFVRTLAHLTLNYWANEGFRRLLFENASMAGLLPNVGVLLGAGALFSLVAVAMIRRRFLRGV
jgi:ABC-2 type transport system permease protein